MRKGVNKSKKNKKMYQEYRNEEKILGKKVVDLITLFKISFKH